MLKQTNISVISVLCNFDTHRGNDMNLDDCMVSMSNMINNKKQQSVKVQSNHVRTLKPGTKHWKAVKQD